MPRPVIGITAYVEPASRGDWVDVLSTLIPHDYVRQVEAVGGLALVVPPRLDATDGEVAEVLSRLDGIVLAGGVDVAPERYAAHRHPSVQASREDRDTSEIAIARLARARDLPMLGICRGMQVMAVAVGGALEQHVPERVGHEEHSPGPATYGSHPVSTVAGTMVREILGTDVVVPSYHHQSVLTHPGYLASAWAADGTLEAMEHPGASFAVAVQWHPEVGSDPRLFEALVESSREQAVRRARLGA